MSKRKNLDPRIKRTHQLLRTALVQLLKEKDINSISIKDITQKADLTRGTFYLHYKDKNDFLIQCTEEILDELIDYVRPNEANPSLMIEWSNPAESFLKLFEFIGDEADFFYLMLSNRGLPEFRDHLLKIVKMKVYDKIILNINESKDGLLISKDILISYITSAHLGVIYSWLEGGMKYSHNYMASQLTYLTVTILGQLGIEKN
ncbi:TetR family transcriptional regulator [Paenibacillus terrae HPL-003]|uniref:TetR family transcriptional regulator n=1 Tax=Paenibacillus terrae (strain HPL-003) TaxID=985665 RepID=G7W4E8_PAETH|nr:TetR/AcrR family transcriptional regulator [Paenibacillus terrae]AET59786.1 TetR family transcriptional regulator [Paenibacillus terrae HPL-003]